MIQCPRCKRILDFGNENPGGEAHCATCGETFSVPDVYVPATRAEEAPAAMCAAEAIVEIVTIKLSPNDKAERSHQYVPPPPRPMHAVPVAPRPEEPAAGRRHAIACPRCKARVLPDEQRCRACGESLDDRSPEWEWNDPFPPERRDYEPARGGMIIALGILGVCLGPLGLPFAVAAWVMGKKDLDKIENNVMDPDGYINTRDGMTCGKIGTGLSVALVLFIGWMMARF